jgi:uncharacterized protein
MKEIAQKSHDKLFQPEKLFMVKKPIIAMLHLAPLPGEPDFTSLHDVAQKAIFDVQALQNSGVNGILIENWNEDSLLTTTDPKTETGMLAVIYALKFHLQVPFGINVLNNDYEAAFRLASQTGASFIELDVFTDPVRTRFSHSLLGQEHPFNIIVDPNDVRAKRIQFHAENIPLIVFIQPKHYDMLEPDKTIEQSAHDAVDSGADGILITKATGTAPDIERIKRTKIAIPECPIGIGSGFSRENAPLFMPEVDFAVVGSATKVDGNVDNPVDPDRVKSLMEIARRFQS